MTLPARGTEANRAVNRRRSLNQSLRTKRLFLTQRLSSSFSCDVNMFFTLVFDNDSELWSSLF